ncbi:MAG: DUF115 domain-containing protein [Spirochaetaceae bacterium]|nr:DUF115 domain-containing protein [Spirochaetaceae bacterium]
MDGVGPEILETGGALNVRCRGRLLYSERGPALIPARTAAAAELGPDRLYLVASPALWYGVPELLARLEPGSALLCVELDPDLAALSLREAPPGLLEDPRLAFVQSAAPEELLARAAELGSFRRCLSLRLSGGEAFHAEAYRRAAALLQAELAASWRNRATLMSMGRLWARNIFKNLAALGEIAPVPLPRVEKPVFVCGAGPSLEAAIPFLAERRGDLALVACDTALPSLLAAGLEPDLVVCLEGQAHNLADFTSAGGRPFPLLADLSSHPATFRALSGPKHLTLVRIAPGGFMSRLRALGLPLLGVPPLGSVGVHAVHAARLLGPGPVLAAGLDFAYERGKTHARGAPALLAEERRLTRLCRFPGQLGAAFKVGVRPTAPGSALLTDPVLSSYAALLAEEAAAPGPLLLDLRGRGLPIGGRAASHAEAAALLDAARAPFPAPRGPEGAKGTEAACSAGADAAAAGAAFIAGESRRLSRLVAALKGRESLDGPAFLELVAGSDYLLWPFPDAQRLRTMPQDLLNRLLVEAEYWRWKLGDIFSGR